MMMFNKFNDTYNKKACGTQTILRLKFVTKIAAAHVASWLYMGAVLVG